MDVDLFNNEIKNDVEKVDVDNRKRYSIPAYSPDSILYNKSIDVNKLESYYADNGIKTYPKYYTNDSDKNVYELDYLCNRTKIVNLELSKIKVITNRIIYENDDVGNLQIVDNYYQSGFNITPLMCNGTKRPILKAWGCGVSPEHFRDWWGPIGHVKWTVHNKEQWSHGVGLIAGEMRDGGPNVEVIDFDTDWKANFKSWKEMIGSNLLKKLTLVKTPNGLHVYYRTQIKKLPNYGSYDCDNGNTKLAQREDEKTLIETRGEGGYTVAPGSPFRLHPTGRLYEVVFGDLYNLNEITIEQRITLFDCAKTFNKKIIPLPEPRKEYIVDPNSTKPGDIWATETPMSSLLQNLGWTHEGGRKWKRPGKKTDGCSAVITDKDNLVNFSSNSPYGMEFGKTYSKLWILAQENFNGDMSKASKYLSENGYNKNKKMNDHIKKILKTNNTLVDLL
jgi:putative DNA primase/helicase